MVRRRLDHDTVVSTEWFAARSALALVATALIGTAFGVLAAFVRLGWPPAAALDRFVTDRLNDLVADRDLLQQALTGVTDLGGTPVLIWMLVVGVAWLLLRRQPRLAVYVAVTALGALVLNAVVKALVARLRPVVDDPVYTVPGWSFPSGHAMSSLVFYGVLFLVFGPMLRQRPRAIFATTLAIVVALVGFTRIALGAHYLTDVVAGWLLGTLWLIATAVAFHHWRQDAHITGAGRLPGELPRRDLARARPVPAHHPPTIPHPWHALGQLTVVWVAIAGTLVGLGALITTQGTAPPPLVWENAVVSWLAENRTPALTDLLQFVGKLGSTPWVLAGYFVVAPLAVALTRNWRPVLFLTATLAGELTLFLTASSIVGRARPQVPQLNPDLPPTASFPSGHVAAVTALYTATALIAWSLTRRWWRWIFVAPAVLTPLAVAFQRLYAGVHYPTDVAGSLLLALPWTFAVWWVMKPGRRTTRPDSPQKTDDGTTADEHSPQRQ